jgi:RimJ/RimL family protein N-acetyltransferase
MNNNEILYKKSGDLVYIKQPEFNELDFVVKLWSDKGTMKDVGGTVTLPKERRREWYAKMVRPSDGKNFYCLIYTKQNKPVGEVSFHRFNQIKKSAELNIKVQSKYRGKGYGKEALKLLLEYYFNEFGGEVITDEVINIKGQRALAKFGFEITSKSEYSVSFKMTKERFLSFYG